MLKSKIVSICILALGLLVLSGARKCPSFDKATKQENDLSTEWIRPGGSVKKPEFRVEPVYLMSVAESQNAKAVSLLDRNSYLALGTGQVADLVGPSVAKTNMGERKPYLLRAVRCPYSYDKCAMEVYDFPDGSIIVSEGSISNCDIPMQRRPVVAWLIQPAHEVYVHFSVTEE